MGRKKIKLKKQDYSKIRRLAKRGVKETDICKALGISFPTWARLKEEDEKAIEVFEEARKVEEDMLVGVLYDAAVNDKNLTAAMFLLKARHGYKEGAEQVNANQVNVKIQMPGAMDSNEYKKLVEVQNDK
ncbi:MAG: hypothetical protein GVY20_17810 [Bacteroidetes bacterium]|jgi:predicted DNA-binding ribbon-helix-helix protein|nr:hypothetical protein [Bacteroidota bacterium]